ncbi:MAG: hypothetical protein AAF991_02740 [Pseudomonadota bacterium]
MNQLRLRPGLPIFTLVKYLTYSLLLANIYFFMQEELGSLSHTFSGSLSFAEFVQVFAATIDTAAWVIVLLLFELETCVLEDEQLTTAVKRLLHGVRILCGAAVLWAFFGYCSELITIYDTVPLANWDACARVAEQWSVLQRLDEYLPLTEGNCEGLRPPLSQISGFSIVAEGTVLQTSRYLAWADVINSAAWILVVLVLEIEVRLQLKGRLTDSVVAGTRYVKYVLYGTLFTAAIYWGFKGKFLDFWDAALWLFAFIFIELNVFDWQQETSAA